MLSIRDKTYFRTSIVYLSVTLFSVILMAVYYALDHGLRDIRMTLLFLPCLLVSVFFFVLSLKAKTDESLWRMFFHMGFAAIYFYLVFSSIVTMADSRNDHIICFFMLGCALLAVSLIVFVYDRIKTKK